MTRKLLMLTSTTALLLGSGCENNGLFVQQQQKQGQAGKSHATVNAAGVPDIQVVDASEVDLVESVLTHRMMYRKSLGMLRDYYEDKGYNVKRQWANQELDEFKKVRPFKYILSAEIPVSSLRPMHSIPEADAMYSRGLALMKEGGHGLPALYRQDKMKEALQVMSDLITQYPTSDKIDDAAFCSGEILKDYFKNQEMIAVVWYERCRQWDPNSPHPALFNAAVVYDFRLHDRGRALELYHRVLEEEEQQNKSNAGFASRRIYELTEGMQRLYDPGNQPAAAGRGTFASPTAIEPVQSQTENIYQTDDDAPSWRSSSNASSSSERQMASDDMVPIFDLGSDDE